jgi:23S rRNA pseudouridine955/2504/2580 synthase
MCAEKAEITPRVKLTSIDQDHHGQRIDNYLMSQLKGVPRSHIYRLLRSGQVRVNKGRIKPHYKLQSGDEVRIPPVRMDTKPPGLVPTAVLEQLSQASLYENNDILVINKPAGLPVHAGSGISYGVIEALKQLYPDQFIELVHRLDRDTSGCLLLARNRDSLTRLHASLRNGHGIEKHYLALVAGHWPGQTTVDVPLEKILRSGEHMVEVSDSGAHARSYFEARKIYHHPTLGDVTLVAVQIETGRTHQIRVHATHSGHPLAGDTKYGDNSLNKQLRALGLKRMFLHASQLTIRLDKTFKVEAPLPEDLQAILDKLDE